MKATDTVMEKGQIHKMRIALGMVSSDGYPTVSDARESKLDNEITEAQAEISFKAGIREVVDWLKGEQAEPDYILGKWQAKLKEWGIK